MAELFTAEQNLTLGAKNTSRILKKQDVKCAHAHRSPKRQGDKEGGSDTSDGAIS